MNEEHPELDFSGEQIVPGELVIEAMRRRNPTADLSNIAYYGMFCADLESQAWLATATDEELADAWTAFAKQKAGS
jgi:hypothetical protein